MTLVLLSVDRHRQPTTGGYLLTSPGAWPTTVSYDCRTTVVDQTGPSSPGGIWGCLTLFICASGQDAYLVISSHCQPTRPNSKSPSRTVLRGGASQEPPPSPDYAIAEITWLVGCYRIDQVAQSGTQSCDLSQGPLLIKSFHHCAAGWRNANLRNQCMRIVCSSVFHGECRIDCTTRMACSNSGGFPNYVQRALAPEPEVPKPGRECREVRTVRIGRR